MAGEIEAYLEAREAFNRHEADIQETRTHIRRFLSASDNWNRLFIPGEQMPVAAVGPGSTAFEPIRWPTGEHIKKLILRWHKLTHQQRQLWERVPESLRTGIAACPT
jgi:hypothetical protein